VSPLEHAYWLALRLHRALRRPRRLPRRVLSVGNLSTGGEGKTPMVAALAQEAERRGILACVLSRGYRGRLRGPVLVEPHMPETQVGDEPLLLARQGLMVVKCRDRYQGGLYALGLRPQVGLFLLDDGFQHWGLGRDLDLVLLDVRTDWRRQRLLPLGRLREPLGALGRAHVVVLVGAKEPPGALLELLRGHTRARVFSAWYEPLGLWEPATGGSFPPEWLRGRPVGAFCGLARPEGFKGMLQGLGAELRGFAAFRDHHRFSQGELRALRGLGRWTVCTEKDIMRIAHPWEGLLVLRVALRAQEGLYECIFKEEA